MCDQQNLRSDPLLVAWIFYECYTTDWTSFGLFYLKMRLHGLVWVYSCQNAAMLEITCNSSHMKYDIQKKRYTVHYKKTQISLGIILLILIRVFSVYSKKACVLSYPRSTSEDYWTRWMLILIWVFAGANSFSAFVISWLIIRTTVVRTKSVSDIILCLQLLSKALTCTLTLS